MNTARDFSEGRDSEGRARPPDEPGLKDRHSSISPSSVQYGSSGTPRPTRKPLGHEVPSWVKDGSVFFVTICAAVRGVNLFAVSPIAEQLLDSVQFLHDRGDWYARIFLIMPDHVHGMISVPSDTSLSVRISAWKTYTAKVFGVAWQDRFFDHRLRSDENLDEKIEYIRRNPVRAGLVKRLEDWPFVFFAINAEPGSSGTPRPTQKPGDIL